MKNITESVSDKKTVEKVAVNETAASMASVNQTLNATNFVQTNETSASNETMIDQSSDADD